MSTAAPNRPPIIEAKKAAPRARAASPRFAIGKPSITVTWPEAEPAIPIRIAVKTSEVLTTATMPISSASAETWSMP